MTKTLEEFVREQALCIRRLFELKGQLLAMIVGEDAENRMTLVGLSTFTEKDKDKIRPLIKRVIKEKNLVRFAFIDEAWMVSRPSGVQSDTRPRDDPDRVEIIIINAEDHHGEMGAMIPIITGERRTLGELEIMRKGNVMSRFTGVMRNETAH